MCSVVNLKQTDFDILKFSLAVRPRGHKQKKLNDCVYSFPLYVSSRPVLTIKLNLNISKVAYCKAN